MMDLDRAIQIAVRAHAGQVDKQGEIYILHPLRVMAALVDPEDKIVGVLHDVIEDSDITMDDLRAQGLSNELCNDIDAVTKRDNETYTSYVLRCACRDRARRVKLADINDNLSRMNGLLEADQVRLRPKYENAKQLLHSISWLPFIPLWESKKIQGFGSGGGKKEVVFHTYNAQRR